MSLKENLVSSLILANGHITSIRHGGIDNFWLQLANLKYLLFQYKCSLEADVDKVSYTDYGLNKSTLSCGYKPADVVTCSVRAFTEIGAGEPAMNTTTVQCGGKFTSDQMHLTGFQFNQ